jgi:putative hemolysin
MPDAEVLVGLGVILVSLLCSAFISGSEVAFFSLTRPMLDELDADGGHRAKAVVELMKRPKRLLATILIANNFVNVGVVIISTYLTVRHVPVNILNYELLDVLPIGWIIQVIGVTVILLMVGEVTPKVYSSQNVRGMALLGAMPFTYISAVLSPVSAGLMWVSSLIDKRKTGPASQQISMDELSHALELATPEGQEELEDQRILEGIVRFGNTPVRAIMCPRLDMEGIMASSDFKAVLGRIAQAGYSRYPVLDGSQDRVVGLVHVKDLLAYIDQPDFDWHTKIRPAFFVPENKMIDDLLEEFRSKRMHMAVVVDEYGGTSGLVTLEDILEEIVGDISDEFDESEAVYSRIDDLNFVFEGKTPIKHFCRATGAEEDEFDAVRGESDTLAGLILEMKGAIPQKGETLTFGRFNFKIESVDRRRIRRIKVTMTTLGTDESED